MPTHQNAPPDTTEIENVVASTDAGRELDLRRLDADMEAADYDPKQFPGLILRLPEPHGTVLVFRSGAVVCTGATSTSGARTSLRSVLDEFRDLDIEVDEDPEVVVRNIVTAADLGADLDLRTVAIGLGLENVEYEPEQFPGLVYRLDEPDIVALLFGSGKVVITGGKRPEDAAHAVGVIAGELEDLGLLDG
jgi:transcription initiation factor TFIID TATA-box-binding protein